MTKIDKLALVAFSILLIGYLSVIINFIYKKTDDLSIILMILIMTNFIAVIIFRDIVNSKVKKRKRNKILAKRANVFAKLNKIAKGD